MGALAGVEGGQQLAARLVAIDDRNPRALDERLLDDRRANAAGAASYKDMAALEPSRHRAPYQSATAPSWWRHWIGGAST